jgi:hypothetical protein
MALSISDAAFSADKKRKLEQRLQSFSGCTRAALRNILAVLHEEGQLGKQLQPRGSSTTGKDMQLSMSTLAKDASTPYGPILKRMHLNIQDFDSCPVVCPLAWLSHFTKLCEPLGKTLKEIINASSKLRIILYIDEIQPGNPLRPDKTRCTQAVYWTFAEMPDWLLCKATAWFFFCGIRSSIVSRLAGGVSELACRILEFFFLRPAQNFSIGCLIHAGESCVLCQAQFEGFLADEKAHKELFAIKGASGMKPCLSCKNVCRFLPTSASGYLVDLSCVELNKLDKHTCQSIFEMADMLSALHGGRKAALEEMQKVTGINLCKTGLLFNADLRQSSVLQPSKNMIRDWMHTLVSHGVASSELALFLHALQEASVELSQITTYSMSFVLPRCRGKPDKMWFDRTRIGEDDMRTPSASDNLMMLKLLWSFVQEVVAPLGLLPEHRRCFDLICQICAVLQLGPSRAASCVAKLQHLIAEHNRLFCHLYSSHVKPKLHHLFHLPEDIRRVGKSIACFTLERKHIILKAAMLHTFRHFEETVCANVINLMTAYADPAKAMFASHRLVNPMSVRAADGTEFSFASSALLPVGHVNANDVAILTDGCLGRVSQIFSTDGDREVVLQMNMYVRIGQCLWSHATTTVRFVNSVELQELVAWTERPGSCIFTATPC